MALYVGSTAASSVANPPIEMTNGLGGAGNRTAPGTAIWSYSSTNTSTEITAVGFFTDGQSLGMKVGDIMLAVYQSSVGSTAPIPYMGCIGAVSSTGASLNTASS